MLDESFRQNCRGSTWFEVVAHTADCPIAATQNVEKKLYAVQFHPEVLHTKNGTQMIYNFVRGVCGCAGTWKMDSFVKIQSRKSERRSVTAKCSLHFQAE